ERIGHRGIASAQSWRADRAGQRRRTRAAPRRARGRGEPVSRQSAARSAARAAMTLGELVKTARTLGPDAAQIVARAGAADTPVRSIAHDSRAVAPGTVFVAVPGQRADGAAFADQAIARGAVAVVSELHAPAGVKAPWIRTPDARLALAELSAIAYGNPSERLTVAGITGTNGKTTTA